MRSQLDAVQDGVTALQGLAGAVARSVQSVDFLAAQHKEKNERDERAQKEKDEKDDRFRDDIHALATSLSNHHVVLFGPQGSHKMGVVADVSTLMAAHNQQIGGWKVAAVAVTAGSILGPIIAWALQHYVPHP